MACPLGHGGAIVQANEAQDGCGHRRRRVAQTFKQQHAVTAEHLDSLHVGACRSRHQRPAHAVVGVQHVPRQRCGGWPLQHRDRAVPLIPGQRLHAMPYRCRRAGNGRRPRQRLQRAALRRRSMLVGAKLGPGELRAAWSKLDDRTAANVDRKLAAAGYDHPLAKQTLVYGTVVRDKTRGNDAANGFDFVCATPSASASDSARRCEQRRASFLLRTQSITSRGTDPPSAWPRCRCRWAAAGSPCTASRRPSCCR